MTTSSFFLILPHFVLFLKCNATACLHTSHSNRIKLRYVRVSDEDRGAVFQQPGQGGGDACPTGNVKGCHSSLGLVGVEEEGGKRGGGKQEFGEDARVACLGGGVKGGDESGGGEESGGGGSDKVYAMK
jgi:hypothetical protein